MSDTVLFSYRNHELPENGTLPDVDILFDALHDQGLKPLLTLGAEEAYQGPGGVETHSLVGESGVAFLGHVALDEVGVVVNRLGRSFKTDIMPARPMPPMINENGTRSLAFRKHRVDKEVFDPLKMGIPTTLGMSLENVDDFLAAHPTAARFVVKPTSGTDSKGVRIVGREDVGAIFRANPALLETQVVQPAYDFSTPFPDSLHPYDAQSREAFAGWGTSRATKELRIYGFHSPESTQTFPVARATVDGVDHWVFVDKESVPDELHQQTAAAIQLAAQVSGATAMLGTVDYGYGALATEQPDWHAIELNGKAPYLIGRAKHQGIAIELRRMFAQQIAETIR